MGDRLLDSRPPKKSREREMMRVRERGRGREVKPCGCGRSERVRMETGEKTLEVLCVFVPSLGSAVSTVPDDLSVLTKGRRRRTFVRPFLYK